MFLQKTVFDLLEDQTKPNRTELDSKTELEEQNILKKLAVISESFRKAHKQQRQYTKPQILLYQAPCEMTILTQL